MNCKPGDLAVIRRGAAAGHYVTVVEATSDPEPVPTTIRDGWWVVILHGPAINAERELMRQGDEAVAHDNNLRPIRDPGEDAKDEMLRPLPAEPVPA